MNYLLEAKITKFPNYLIFKGKERYTGPQAGQNAIMGTTLSIDLTANEEFAFRSSHGLIIEKTCS